jgi:multisubunit Na+/H+ antiporter MnhG subunit
VGEADSMTGSDEPLTPDGPERTGRRFPLVAFTLFASYCFAANAAIALHELGHAVGIWLAGGRVLGLYLAPQGYAGSYAARDFSVPFTSDHGRLLQVAGGPAFGAACGVVLLLAARGLRRGGVGWIVIHGMGTWCIGNNGAYLILGSLHPFGDALFLTELGVPHWVLFLSGLPLVVVFLALFASFLRGIGLRREDSYGRWLLTVEAGLLGYLVLIFGWRVLRPTDGQLPATANDLVGLAYSPVVLWLLATCVYPFRNVVPAQDNPSTDPQWMKAGMLLALGLLFMAAEVVFFSYDYEAATGGRVSSAANGPAVRAKLPSVRLSSTVQDVDNWPGSMSDFSEPQPQEPAPCPNSP